MESKSTVHTFLFHYYTSETKDKCIFMYIKILGCFDVCLLAPVTCFLLVLTASPNPPQQITA